MVWKMSLILLRLIVFSSCLCEANRSGLVKTNEKADDEFHFECSHSGRPAITLYTVETTEQLRETFSDFVEKDGAKMVIFWLDFEKYQGVNPMRYNLTEYYDLSMWTWVYDGHGKSLLRFSSEAKYLSLGLLYMKVETLHVKFDNRTQVGDIAHLSESCKLDLGEAFLTTVIDVEERKDKENCACSRYVTVTSNEDQIIRFSCCCDLQLQSMGNMTECKVQVIEDTVWTTSLKIVLSIFLSIVLYTLMPIIVFRLIFLKLPVGAKFKSEKKKEFITVPQSDLIANRPELNIIEIISLINCETDKSLYLNKVEVEQSRGDNDKQNTSASNCQQENPASKCEQENCELGNQVSKYEQGNLHNNGGQRSCVMAMKVMRLLGIFIVNATFVPIGLWLSLVYRLSCSAAREEEQNAWEQFNDVLPQYNDVFIYFDKAYFYFFFILSVVLSAITIVILNVSNHKLDLLCIMHPLHKKDTGCHNENIRAYTFLFKLLMFPFCNEISDPIDKILIGIYLYFRNKTKNETQYPTHIFDNLPSLGEKMYRKIYKCYVSYFYQMSCDLPFCLNVLLLLLRLLIGVPFLFIWGLAVYCFLIILFLQPLKSEKKTGKFLGIFTTIYYGIVIIFQVFLLLFSMYNISIICAYVLMGVILNVDVLSKYLAFLVLLSIYVFMLSSKVVQHYDNLMIKAYVVCNKKFGNLTANFVACENLTNCGKTKYKNDDAVIFKDVPFVELRRRKNCILRALFSHICSHVSPVPVKLMILVIQLTILTLFLIFTFSMVISFYQSAFISTLSATAVGLLPLIFIWSRTPETATRDERKNTAIEYAVNEYLQIENK